MALIRLTRICWLCRGFNKIAQKMMKVLGGHQVQSQARSHSNFGGHVADIQDQFSQGEADGLVHLSSLNNHIGRTCWDGNRLDQNVVNLAELNDFGIGQGVTPDQFSKNCCVGSAQALAPSFNLETLSSKQHAAQVVNLFNKGGAAQ